MTLIKSLEDLFDGEVKIECPLFLALSWQWSRPHAPGGHHFLVVLAPHRQGTAHAHIAPIVPDPTLSRHSLIPLKYPVITSN